MISATKRHPVPINIEKEIYDYGKGSVSEEMVHRFYVEDASVLFKNALEQKQKVETEKLLRQAMDDYEKEILQSGKSHSRTNAWMCGQEELKTEYAQQWYMENYLGTIEISRNTLVGEIKM